jgi:hypothetical protein
MFKSSPKNGQEFHKGGVVRTTLSDLTFEHIDERYAPKKFARELLATVGRVTPNTARNWLRRVCAPQTDNFGAMVENDPEFRAKVRDWIESFEN